MAKIEVALMLEGQNGLTWPRFQRIAQLAEDLGFVGLFRSDHYTNADPPDRESLELWVSLTWLASHTRRIEFGSLVSPVSFRDPTMTARMAAAVDDLSGGRLVLGLGAGWQQREHHKFGWDLLTVPERFHRFEDGLQVITCLLRSDTPSSFRGKYFYLDEAILLPRPARPGGPPLLIGGNGPRYTLPLVVRYAQEWNAVFLPAGKFARRNQQLSEMLREAGRDPASVRRSVMMGTAYGRDQAGSRELVERYLGPNHTLDDWRQRGNLAGSPSEFVEAIGKMAEAGAQRIMLQWFELDDIDRLEHMAAHVLPQVS